jgi:RNA polymerase sigma-B factor
MTGVLVQPHQAGTAPGRPRGGPRDCGCGRTSCRDDFATLATTVHPAARALLRNRLVERHLDLAYSLAGRYWWPGPGFEDLRQVAALALVEAVNRFDPGMDTAFSAFAVPTVVGALKRHFRDQRWIVHPPRRVKELRVRIRATIDLLTQQLRRMPTVVDLAERLECSPQEIREALATDDAMRPLSIDAPVQAVDDDTLLAATLGDCDVAYNHVDDVETLGPLLAELPEREQRVITMRFVGNLSQSQIAHQIGCSQMHVSRILRAALGRLRRALQYPAQSPAPVGNRAGRPAHTEPTIDSPSRRVSCRPTPNRPRRQLRVSDDSSAVLSVGSSVPSGRGMASGSQRQRAGQRSAGPRTTTPPARASPHLFVGVRRTDCAARSQPRASPADPVRLD